MTRLVQRSSFLAALVLLTSGLCRAQEEDDTNAEESDSEESDSEESGFEGLGGRGYLGIDTQLFSISTAQVTTVSTTPTGPPITSTSEYTATQVGLASPSWGFGFGYAFGDYVAFGGQLAFESATVSVGNTKSKATGVSVAPNVRVLMAANRDVVPYVSAMIGYKKLTTEVNGSSNGVGIVNGAMYGGGLGLFLFPNPNVSFEPSFNVLWTTVEDEFGPSSATAVGFYLCLSLSAWFGDEPASPSVAKESEHVEGTVPSTENENGKVLRLYMRHEDYELNLKVAPSDNIPEFDLSLLIPVTEERGCDTIQLQSSEREVVLPANPSDSMDGKRRVLLSTVPYQALRLGVDKEMAHITTCGMKWELTSSERLRVLKLLANFHRRAKAEGTLKAAAAVPLPNQTPSDETPSAVSPESE